MSNSNKELLEEVKWEAMALDWGREPRNGG